MSANSPLVDARQRFADLPSAAVWAPLWAVVASMAWLLPNHYRPWLSFHTDAWMAWTFAAGGGLLLLGSRSPLPLHRFSVLAGILVAVPGLQWAWGLLPVPGLAWIATLYLLGFVLTLVVGARAEQDHPEVAVSALLLAITVAAVASVGIQLHQWVSVDVGFWIRPIVEMRFYGNLGQPNQMATFQIWGLLGVGWFLQRRQISPPVALLLALLLLLGIALTQSRTAILSLGILAIMAIVWRRLWTAPRVVRLAASLATWFTTCLMAIKPISEALLLPASPGSVERSWSGDTRWQAYRMFVDAVFEKPWLGYGWATAAPAHLAVADSHPKLSIVFEHSHNLFLDLVLWLGLPLGLVVSVALVLWLARQIWCVSAPKDAILVMFVVVVGLHAMLELPLQYAYMLLPVALVMGALQTRSQARVVVLVSRRTFIGLWLGTVLLLGAVTRDYFLIEADLEAIRFEKIYRIEAPAQPPPVLVLSHLSDFIRLGRSGAKPGMPAEEIEKIRIGAYWFPSSANLYLYTAALALNGQPDEARQMMRKTERVISEGQYETIGQLWKSQTLALKSLPPDVPSWLPPAAVPKPQPLH